MLPAAAKAVGVGAGMAFGSSTAVASTATTAATFAGGLSIASFGAFSASSIIEQGTGGFNPIRDSLFGGNQGLYEIMHMMGGLGTLGVAQIGAANYGLTPARATGFNTFYEAKKALGPAGDGKAWHHIVEQNQISRSGFNPQSIHSPNNLVAIESGFRGSIHSQISGYYTSIQPLTGGATVRQWLSGQSYQQQFNFGLQQLGNYGTMTKNATGWIFTPF